MIMKIRGVMRLMHGMGDDEGMALVTRRREGVRIHVPCKNSQDHTQSPTPLHLALWDSIEQVSGETRGVETL